jgi:hypothetical protein
VFRKKTVVIAILLALVLSMSAFVAFAQDDAPTVQRDGWEFVEGDTNVYYLRDGVRVTGVQNVTMPEDWWPFGGTAPATAYFLFGADGAQVRGAGWTQSPDGYVWLQPGYSLFQGWHYYAPELGVAGTIHKLTPVAATGVQLVSDIPATWSYDPGRVTHRWFNFHNRGQIVEMNLPGEYTGAWHNGAFYFGHGVTQGWVYIANADPVFQGELVYYPSGVTPVFATGVQTLENPWFADATTFTFNATGRLQAYWGESAPAAADMSVESFLPGITFVVIGCDDYDEFSLVATAGATSMQFSVEDLHDQPNGDGWRVAIPLANATVTRVVPSANLDAIFNR